MTVPVHYATGAMSALLIQNFLPIGFGDKTRVSCAFAVAIASHIVADAIPHAEHFLVGRYFAMELVVETIVMLAVLVGASCSPFIAKIILAGMAGAAIPDWFGMLSSLVGWPVFSWLDDKMHLFHGKFNLFYANYFLQLVMAILCSIYVRIKSAE